jgi:hypothetical protein
MAENNESNSERLFTWTQLYELTRLPPAPKRSVGRPQESAFPRSLLGIYLNPDEKKGLLALQKDLKKVLGKKPSYGEVLGIISRIYSTILFDEKINAGSITSGFVRPKGGRKMVSFLLSTGEKREFFAIKDRLQSEPDLANLKLSYGDVFILMVSAFQETLAANPSLLKSNSLIEFAQDFVAAEMRHA